MPSWLPPVRVTKLYNRFPKTLVRGRNASISTPHCWYTKAGVTFQLHIYANAAWSEVVPGEKRFPDERSADNSKTRSRKLGLHAQKSGERRFDKKTNTLSIEIYFAPGSRILGTSVVWDLVDDIEGTKIELSARSRTLGPIVVSDIVVDIEGNQIVSTEDLGLEA